MLNESIRNVAMPPRIKRLPISPKGFPVPWFVAYIDGEPDFRVIGPGKFRDALQRNRCWICGEPTGARKAFVIGPMCTINRVSAEPPSHLDCAEYAVRACPFLSKPRMRRNEADLPKDHQNPAGIMIKRNPGVAAIWITRHFSLMREGGGVLYHLGEPERVLWFAEGQPASRAQVDLSIATGLPELEAAAALDGPEGTRELRQYVERAQQWLPT